MKEGKAYKYAVWCSTEQEGKVPEYVKKQAESWLHIADGNDEDAYVDEQEYEKICKLLKLMVHPDLRCSIYDGLEDYAWFMIVAGLCTYCRNSEQRSRFYVTILLEIARKNFKTFNSAVIFILLMLTEPDFSRFFSVAPDLQLSSELKNAIRKIIKVSPALYDEDEPAFKVLRSQIICLLNENEYTPLAYSQDGMDGKLANAYLADEAGALDDYPVEAMRSSQITLFNKLGIIISTQYPNDNNVMIDEIDIAKKTLDGLLDDRRYFALLYEPDDDLKQGEAWQTDDRAIYQSNPVAVSHQYIFDEIKKKRTLAVLYENKRENYLCKHNNILYKGLGVEGYIDIQKVKLCRIQPDPQWWNGRQVWVGVDLSQTDDNTAVAMVTEDNGYIYARVMGFIPKEKINIKTQKEHVDYQRMISKGECIACGEEVIDYSVVENYVIHLLEEEYGVIVEQVGYDRYNAISSVQKMEAEGLECVEIKQHPDAVMQIREIKCSVKAGDIIGEKLENHIQELDDNITVKESRKSGIERRERILNIQPSSSSDLETRKIAVIARWCIPTMYTERILQKRLQSMLGDGYSLEVNIQKKTVSVTLQLKHYKNRKIIWEMLEGIVPLDQIIDVIIIYNTYRAYKPFTYKKLKAKTYDQLRTEVIQ